MPRDWQDSPVLNPWRWCDSDDGDVADFLAASVEGLFDVGGWIHPDARLVARSGQIHVECEAPDGELLFHVPHAAFLRVGQVSFTSGDQMLEVNEIPDGMTGTEYSLLLTQVGLHNSSGKIPWLAANHPVLAPDVTDDVTDAVRIFRPSFRRRFPTPASVLWSDRCFRLPVDGDRVEPVALPVLDLLNHHAGGTTGLLTDEGFQVQVRRAAGTKECFLNYGLQRDAIGMAVVYGFTDDSNPQAHSAPVTVSLPDGFSIEVLARGRASSGELLGPVLCEIEGGWTISRLSFGAGDAAAHLASVSKTGAKWSVSVVHAVASANLGALKTLLRCTQADGSAASSILAGAARRQRDVIRAYVGDSSWMAGTSSLP